MALFLISLFLLAEPSASDVDSKAKVKPMTYGQNNVAGLESPYWIRLEEGKWNAENFDMAQICDGLVHMELRKLGSKFKARDLIHGVKICLRAKGIDAVVERNPKYRGP